MGYKVNNFSKTTRRASKLSCAAMFMLLVYVFFMYMSSEFLLPPRILSLAMWGFLGCVGAELIGSTLNGGWRGVRFQEVGRFRNATEDTFVRLGGNINFAVGGYTKWYFTFYLWSAFSLAWAREWSLGTLYLMTVSLVLTYCFLHTLESWARLELCFKAWAISAALAALCMLATGQVMDSDVERFGQSETTNANSFAFQYMFAGILSSWLWVVEKGKKKWLYAICCALILVILLRSGGRKSFATVVFALACAMFLYNNGSFLKKLFVIVKLASILVVIFIVVMYVPAFYDTIGHRFVEIGATITGEGHGSRLGSDIIRKQMIEIGWTNWWYSPIWGHGFDSFKYFNREVTGHFFYSHNNYIELLYNEGIIGFILYYSFFGRTLTQLLKTFQIVPKYKILGITLILSILISDIGGMSYSNMGTQLLVAFAFVCSRVEKMRDYRYELEERTTVL